MRRRMGSAFGWLLVLSFPAAAQRGEVRGVVRSGDQPASRALIEARSVDTVRGYAVADNDGRYALLAPPGAYTLVFRRIGYAERRIPDVRVLESGRVTVDANLDPVVLTLDHTVVSALRRSEKALNTPTTVSVVDDQAVRERDAVTALDYVLTVPGIDLVRQGIQGRQVVARGFNQTFGTSLLMMADYRTASMPSLRGNLSHFVTTVEDDLDRVEVLRGPASALYGPNAADGVVHFITKSPFESPGTSMSVVTGGRSLGQAMLRYAAVPSDRVAFKVSGKFLRAREWGAPTDPAELTARDPLIQRVGGDARMDVRVTPTGTAVFSLGSTLAMKHVEYTSIGASQIRDWRYDFAQARYSDGRLFAQVFANVSDAGRSFDLRTTQPVYDRSRLVVGQLQHGFEAGRNTLTYGIDVQRTTPKTNETINGRNEGEDASLETGAYAQAETRITPQWTLLSAARVDRHSRIDGVVLSPRLALQYAPADGQRWRVSYNRAFTTPTATDLFLDIVAARLSPLPFSVRAIGVPKEGFQFARDCGGLCMRSPFAPGKLPLDAAALWPAVVQIMRANNVDLSALPAPTKNDVKTVLRTLDPAAGSFRATTAAVGDIEALKPTITNTIEAGYKRLISGRLLFDASVYATRRENFRGPLAVETPNAFLSTADLTAYFGRFMPAAQAGPLAAAIGGIDGNAQATGIPLGTVTPDGPLAGSDIVLTYRNFGRVELWGTDLSADWLASTHVSIATAYSYTSDNYFPSRVSGDADLSLNAPRHKGLVSVRYRDPARQFSAEMRGRYVDAFHMVDGVWIGDVRAFGTADLEVGIPVPGWHAAQFTLTLENLADNRHAEFVGAPVLGRMLMTRLQYRF